MGKKDASSSTVVSKPVREIDSDWSSGYNKNTRRPTFSMNPRADQRSMIRAWYDV
jgi:hypothetical protein